MSVQRLHAFEKTSIQARHSIKRLEMIIDNRHSTEDEVLTAKALLQTFKNIRALIPPQYQDVDLNEKE
jgi:hypothetical protein